MKIKQDYSKLQIQMAQLKKQYQDAVCQRLQLNKQVYVQAVCNSTSSHVHVHTRTSHTHARKQRCTYDMCLVFVALCVGTRVDHT